MKFIRVVLFVLLVLATMAPSLPAAAVVKAGDHFQVIPAANGRGEITLVGNGLNYQDAAGNWIESKPVVLEYSDAIICTGATYRVILAANLNTHGAVDLELPADPETGARARMISHPLGLAFYDPETGDSVLLARLQDCAPEVVSNKVVYADAFAGANGVQGAITYTYGVGRFHQDVILTARPKVTPADFGMGGHTRLEILTEFVEMPAPEITEKTLRAATNSVSGARAGPAAARPALVDQTLSYGTMRMGMGRAFATPEASQSAATRDSLPVVKQLVNIENRTVLTEAVEWNIAAAALEKLPRASRTNAVRQASATRPGSRREMLAQLNASSPRPSGERAGVRGTHAFANRLAEIQRLAPQRLASLVSQPTGGNLPTGFVIDYELVQTCYSFTFQSGHTYLINSYVSIGYATFESGSVTKFASGQLAVTYNLTCPNSGPKAVLTEVNDDSVGDMISSSTHHFTGYHGSGLDLSQLGSWLYLGNLDIRFMAQGVYGPAMEGVTCLIYDCWFFKCEVGVFAGSPDSTYVYSADFCQVTSPMSEYVSFNYYYCTTCAVTDRDGDYLPDTWEMQHFGGLSQGVNDDYDGDGTLNGAEYSAGTDPNTITFSVAATNNYVGATSPTLHLTITGGHPFSKAVLINTTNFATASWTNYTSTNLTVNLGPTDGWHEVWIGLRGRLTTSEQAWQWKRLKLDRVPPSIVITSPSNSTVNVPLIQLRGYSPEELGRISCDVSNAVGVVTNLNTSTASRSYNKTTWEFTTNYFECLDIDLTNGLNTITVHATDVAGNVTVTNFNYTLNYATATNPVVSLTWPTNGMVLCGDSFTLRGQVDDPTAMVQATITHTNGGTNIITGEVERNGRYWVENLPLNTGTNWITLNVTNAAGLASLTNFYVVQNAMTLTLSNVDGDLWQPAVNVSGLVSDSTAAIYVNGVPGTNNGDGTWNAVNVPVSPGGVASFDLKAVPAIEDDPDSNTNFVKPAKLYLLYYMENDSGSSSGTIPPPNSPGNWNWTFHWNLTNGFEWMFGFGGSGSGHWDVRYGNKEGCQDFSSSSNDWSLAVNWDTLWGAESYAAGNKTLDCSNPTPQGNSSSGVVSWIPPLVLESCAVKLPVGPQGWEHVPLAWQGSGYTPYPTVTGDYQRTAQAVMVLQTGGKALSRRQNLFCLTASAAEVTNKYAGAVLDENFLAYINSDTKPIPNGEVEIDGWPLGADGKLWRAYADNQTIDVTPKVRGKDYFTFNILPTKYTPTISWTGGPAITNQQAVVVGQNIRLDCELRDEQGNPPPSNYGITNYEWTVPGITFSNYVADESSAVLSTNFTVTTNTVDYYWVDGGKRDVECQVSAGGFNLVGQANFKVLRPEISLTLTPKWGDVSVIKTTCRPDYYQLTTGNLCIGTNGVGMYFNFSVLDMKGYSGDFSVQMVQLVDYDSKLTWTNTFDHILESKTTKTGYVLDTTYPYYGSAYVSGQPVTNTWDHDTPSVKLFPLDREASRSDHFEDYLMFTPAGGKPVPLKLATWNWSGTAYYVAGNPDGFAPCGNVTIPKAAVGAECFNHPQWTNNVEVIMHEPAYSVFSQGGLNLCP